MNKLLYLLVPFMLLGAAGCSSDNEKVAQDPGSKSADVDPKIAELKQQFQQMPSTKKKVKGNDQ